MEKTDKELTVPKWVLIIWPKIPQMPPNLSVEFVCPSPKVWDFNEKIEITYKVSSKKISTHFKQVLLRPQYHQRIDRQVIHMYSQAALHLPGRQLRALPQYHTRASRGFKHSIFHENCEKASAALNGESIFHPEKNPSFLFPCVPHCVLNFQILSINYPKIQT